MLPEKKYEERTITAGGAIFTRLKTLGIDYVFVNSGTDFPPIVEGLAEAAAKGIDLPSAITVPHEMVAVSMAHGHYLGSGQPQCVMLHTNVGLANAASGIINAACDRIPLIVMSGRTPTLEQGRFGARTVPIGWGQEMKDQTALVREASKWDYELRFPEQVTEVLDRANAIAGSTPKGPVYVALPREVLCETISADNLDAEPVMKPVAAAPDPDALRQAAELLANAGNPLVVAQHGVGTTEAFERFGQFVTDWALPVSQYWPIQMALPIAHPMCLGTAPTSHVAEADVILVIDSLAPWWPDRFQPNPNAKVIQLGPDPLFSCTPIRNFRADVSLVGETSQTLMSLMDTIGHPNDSRQGALQLRRQKIEKQSAQVLGKVRTQAQAQGGLSPTTKEYVAHCLTKVLEKEDCAVFHELGVPLGSFEGSQACSWFQEPASGGLGWSMGAAMGYQLAKPEKLVVATMGDGSYMFCNPTVCHQVAEALELPLITIVLNNSEWAAVRTSVEGLYPDGYAANAGEMPLTALRPSPDFTLTARASRAHTIKVESGDAVAGALEEAVRVARTDRKQVLLDVSIR